MKVVISRDLKVGETSVWNWENSLVADVIIPRLSKPDRAVGPIKPGTRPQSGAEIPDNRYVQELENKLENRY